MEAEEMTIRTLVNFEQEVGYYLAELLECSYGDAQGVLEAHEEFLSNCYLRNDTARETADQIYKL